MATLALLSGMRQGEGRDEEEEGLDLRAAAPPPPPPPPPERGPVSCLSVSIFPTAFFWAHLVHF